PHGHPRALSRARHVSRETWRVGAVSDARGRLRASHIRGSRVSRETSSSADAGTAHVRRGDQGVAMLESEPPSAVGLFGDRIELARAFTADLAKHGEERGLIGPLELERLWSRHV